MTDPKYVNVVGKIQNLVPENLQAMTGQNSGEIANIDFQLSSLPANFLIADTAAGDYSELGSAGTTAAWLPRADRFNVNLAVKVEKSELPHWTGRLIIQAHTVNTEAEDIVPWVLHGVIRFSTQEQRPFFFEDVLSSGMLIFDSNEENWKRFTGTKVDAFVLEWTKRWLLEQLFIGNFLLMSLLNNLAKQKQE